MSRILSIKTFGVALMALLTLGGFSISTLSALAQTTNTNVSTGQFQTAANSFATGNIMTAGNRTSGTVDWGDPINAYPGEVIEFRVVAHNVAGGTTVANVKVNANLPSTPGTSINASSTVSGDNTSSVSDTATINVVGGEQQGFAYIPGHARVFSPSCPNGCEGSQYDAVVAGGVNVGNLNYNESAQVLFKAYVTNNEQPSPSPSMVASPQPSPSPSPVPSPSLVPSPSPSRAPSPSPSASVVPSPSPVASPSVSPSPQGSTNQTLTLKCPDGRDVTVTLIAGQNANANTNTLCQSQQQQQTQQNNQNQYNNNNQSVNITNSNTAPAGQAQVLGTTIVKELPKTGLPLIAWGIGALAPAGFGLKKFSGKNAKKSESAKYLWEDREFKKN